ncbi:MAG TPA: glucose-6-phosphate dehydrogenase, partial [Nitrospira sp.]|nr:glucose-6-phosphate dehydrogenase [Nitrospira sp.]
MAPTNGPRIDSNPAQEPLPPVEPCTLVIFGGSGDLARRRLIPAVYNLLLDGLLPSNYVVLGLGRTPMSDEEFRSTVRDGVVKHSRQALIEDTWTAFSQHLFYMAGGNDETQTFARLKERVEELEQKFQLPGNRIFYLSIPPSSFTDVCEGLSRSGLAGTPGARAPYTRIIVEKPVGR